MHYFISRLLLLLSLSSSIILIICFPKYYIHYCSYDTKIIEISDWDLINIIAIIVSDCTCTQKWWLATQTGFNSQNTFVYIWGICHSKNIAKSRWSVHHRFGRHPQETGFSIIFAPPKLHERDATEPNIRPNVYLADALPSESSRIVWGQPEQTVAWPKHGDASCSHGTHHTEPISMRGISRCNPVRFITCHGTIPMPTS